MFDRTTANLIRGTPPLEGLDRENLPDRLSELYAKIVTARFRLRTGEYASDEELARLVSYARQLAFTNEALVSVSPNRDKREAAAFVAATAHQLVFNAEQIGKPESPRSHLGARSVSADIAAMLLFLVAEAWADALEMSLRVEAETDDPVERTLILALRALAQGRPNEAAEYELPPKATVGRLSAADAAVSALYLMILKGVRVLAREMLRANSSASSEIPIEIFEQVKTLCTYVVDLEAEGMGNVPVSSFSGPSHLASLLCAVAGDLSRGRVVAVPPPNGIDPTQWQAYVEQLAERRPILWRNHRKAIRKGYLEPGVSAAVGFPTGAGKSTLAELKIAATLLRNRSVVFLAPTNALVDQTRNSLAHAFPSANVRREFLDQAGFPLVEDSPPDILVMTPEACLARMSFDASIFKEAGLMVFDECHLLHPNEVGTDRRALDAMLCVLYFARLAAGADLMLLSAMMKNSEEIAKWIADLTERRCLSLLLPWKPTRQLRGCVVYEYREIADLVSKLLHLRQDAPTTKVPNSVKRQVPAQPFGLFSLKQTWATKEQTDYAFLPLLEQKPLLGINKYWRMTPNSGVVSSAIAAAAAQSGIRTLVFFQNIRNANSAADKISKLLGSTSIHLSERERRLHDIARRELGGDIHLFLRVQNDHLQARAAVHHGLLLPEERRLVESLYERSDGIEVLTATSTVAQGMNLPSELVIIAEDSRFDRNSDQRQILKAQELLNAAGRAGRAGHIANGIVLVVPGKVVGFNYEEAKIGPHWAELHKVFGQSDQCLTIDDPLTAVLDSIHSNPVDAGALEQYCVAKMAGSGVIDESVECLSWSVKRSLCGFRARQGEDHAWLEARIEAATVLLERHATEEENDTNYRGIAATVGVSVNVVSSLAQRLEYSSPSVTASVTEWCTWFFAWLTDVPSLLDQIIRPKDLEYLLGKPFNQIEEDQDRGEYAVPILNKLTAIWMSGRPLREIEIALGVGSTKLNFCAGARKFVIRIIPSLAYAFSLPSLLKQYRLGEGEPGVVPPQLAELANCVRHGFDSHEKAALNQLLQQDRLSRVMLHEHFSKIQPQLPDASDSESWEETLARVRAALLAT